MVPKNHFQWFGDERIYGKIFKTKKVDLFEGTSRKHSNTAINSFFGLQRESEDQGMFFFGLFPTASYSNQEHNIFTFETFSIGANNRYFAKAQLEVNNSIYYPQLEMTADEEADFTVLCCHLIQGTMTS